jgi:hypothetical protein
MPCSDCPNRIGNIVPPRMLPGEAYVAFHDNGDTLYGYISRHGSQLGKGDLTDVAMKEEHPDLVEARIDCEGPSIEEYRLKGILGRLGLKDETIKCAALEQVLGEVNAETVASYFAPAE